MMDDGTHYKLGTFTGFACGRRTGISTARLEEVTCTGCLIQVGRAVSETEMEVEQPIVIRPITAIQINDISISGDQFEMGSFHHDVNKGTVTLTFCNVEVLHTIYSDMGDPS